MKRLWLMDHSGDSSREAQWICRSIMHMWVGIIYNNKED